MIEPSAQTRSPVFSEDSSATTYREIHLPRIFAPWAGVLLEIVPTLPDDSVLDVATGPGTVALQAARLAGAHGRVVGVDFSPAMLRIARAWPAEPGAAPIEYIESSAMSMPLPDATFDVAYCQQGLQHMSDPFAALREMRRLLKVDGRIGVATWSRSPFGLFREVVAQLGYPAHGVQSISDYSFRSKKSSINAQKTVSQWECVIPPPLRGVPRDAAGNGRPRAWSAFPGRRFASGAGAGSGNRHGPFPGPG